MVIKELLELEGRSSSTSQWKIKWIRLGRWRSRMEPGRLRCCRVWAGGTPSTDKPTIWPTWWSPSGKRKRTCEQQGNKDTLTRDFLPLKPQNPTFYTNSLCLYLSVYLLCLQVWAKKTTLRFPKSSHTPCQTNRHLIWFGLIWSDYHRARKK